MTYPDDRVQQFLAEHFVFLQIDTSQREDSLRELYRAHKPFWAPLFLATSSRGAELRRWFGYATPEGLIAELEMVIVADLMIQRREAEAAGRLERLLAGEASGPLEPEATFWLGVASFKAGDRDFEALTKHWTRLIETWPQSVWAMRANVLDMRK